MSNRTKGETILIQKAKFIRFEDGSRKYRPMRSIFATPEERAADYEQKGLVAMENDEWDNSEVYFAWAAIERSIYPDYITAPFKP